MPKRKKGNPPLWSVPRIRDPRYPGWTVRVTELKGGGTLYAVYMKEGKQRMASLRRTRSDLGRTAKAQEQGARALALDIIAALAESNNGGAVEPAETGEAMTLDRLADLYEKHGLHGVGASYRRDQVAKVRRIAAFLGGDRPVVSLCRSDIRKFEEHRLKEGVRRSTVHGDLDALKIACNWATEHKGADGQTLLDRNPLAKVRVVRDTPRRPWATAERYQQLKSVACKLPPAFGCVLYLAWGTGRRISAILGLRWQDVILETSKEAPHGSIRWYAGRATNNKVHEQIIPMSRLARQTLERYRVQCPGIGSGWMFPAPRYPSKPLDAHVLGRWLRKAEELAELRHEPGGGWHMFRRGWATKVKHLPLKDLSAVGGWPREVFRQHGIKYVPSERTKSDIYKELLAPINAARVELLDLPVLTAQLVGLERRVARGGKDSIDHPPHGRDDVVNAAGGALICALPYQGARGAKKPVLWDCR